jgi:putative transposase
MTNHFHLLVTPNAIGGISRMMQTLGRYVRYFNLRHGRTGTLWEGRYRATLIETERYLFTCYRYIEQNPVRAGLVRDPAEYRWSSYAANAFGTLDPIVMPHDSYLALGQDPDARRRAYRALFDVGVDSTTLSEIRHATNHEWALGSDAFRAEVGAGLDRRAAPLPRGRRRKREPIPT